MSTPTTPQIPGYDFGTRKSAESPLSDEDLRNLEQTIGWTNADRDILLKHSSLFQQRLGSVHRVTLKEIVVAVTPPFLMNTGRKLRVF